MDYFKTCPTCRYYLHAVVEDNKLVRVCRTCGVTEEDKGGLIMESYIKKKSSESWQILKNEFTRLDPALPYLKDLKCPNNDCSSNKGSAQKKIYFMKHDNENLKFVYICENCDETWTSR
jgi:DNA-directed RNA polymerase subunit M/transcription elongation factor TFIIS